MANQVNVGDKAPDFTVVDADLKPVTLKDTRGKVRLIAAVPSLDTPVCSIETSRFNAEAEKLPSEQVAVLTISMDLPFAQSRFCSMEGIKSVKVLSDHRHASFGTGYGVLIKDLRLHSRAVFVLDAKDKVRYVEYVREVTEHPDYDAALKAVGDLTKSMAA